MTGRIGALSIDGTPISEADVARMQAEEALHAEWQRKAVRVVAAAARRRGLTAASCWPCSAWTHDVIVEARQAMGPAKPARKRRARTAHAA